MYLNGLWAFSLTFSLIESLFIPLALLSWLGGALISLYEEYYCNKYADSQFYFKLWNYK